MSAATRLRRLLEDDITAAVNGDTSYATAPTTTGGSLEERWSLLLQTPRALHRRPGP